MRIFATWTFQLFYIVLYWNDIQFSQLVVLVTFCVYQIFSPRLGVFLVKKLNPAHNPGIRTVIIFLVGLYACRGARLPLINERGVYS